MSYKLSPLPRIPASLLKWRSGQQPRLSIFPWQWPGPKLNCLEDNWVDLMVGGPLLNNRMKSCSLSLWCSNRVCPLFRNYLGIIVLRCTICVGLAQEVRKNGFAVLSSLGYQLNCVYLDYFGLIVFRSECIILRGYRVVGFVNVLISSLCN